MLFFQVKGFYPLKSFCEKLQTSVESSLAIWCIVTQSLTYFHQVIYVLSYFRDNKPSVQKESTVILIELGNISVCYSCLSTPNFLQFPPNQPRTLSMVNSSKHMSRVQTQASVLYRSAKDVSEGTKWRKLQKTNIRVFLCVSHNNRVRNSVAQKLNKSNLYIDF